MMIVLRNLSLSPTIPSIEFHSLQILFFFYFLLTVLFGMIPVRIINANANEVMARRMGSPAAELTPHETRVAKRFIETI